MRVTPSGLNKPIITEEGWIGGGVDANWDTIEAMTVGAGWQNRAAVNYRTANGGVEMFLPFLASTSRTFASGQLYLALFDPPAWQQVRLPTIRNIEAICSQAPTGLTLAQYAICRASDGVLLANTADFSGSGMNVGGISKPLVSALAMPTVPFYVGALITFTGTAPALAAIGTSGSAGAGAGHVPFPGVASSGLAALPNPVVLTTASAAIPWFGIFG